MLRWLRGRKTYLMAAATFALGGLQACGVVIPGWIYPILASAGLGALRAGVSKASKPAQEL